MGAQDRLSGFFWGGVMASVLGTIGVVAGWPNTNAYTGETGSWWVSGVSGVIAWAGSVMLAIGVIGYGVKLGREASAHLAVADTQD